MRTFFYTNSFDLSTDLLIRRLGSERVFRFNLDLWKEYGIHIRPDGLAITNPAGVMVQEVDIAKFL